MSALVSASTDDFQAIGFLRLRALTAQGYRANFADPSPQPGCFRLIHASGNRNQRVSPLFLWGDGLLMAQHILWPEQHVPSERVQPPDWQKHIAAHDEATFSRFVSMVEPPSAIDLYVRPVWHHTQIFAFKMLFGFSLCASLASAFIACRALCRLI